MKYCGNQRCSHSECVIYAFPRSRGPAIPRLFFNSTESIRVINGGCSVAQFSASSDVYFMSNGVEKSTVTDKRARIRNSKEEN